MNAIPRGGASGLDDPVLFHVAQNDKGLMVDPFSLSYAIFDVSTSARRIAPLQVFPLSGFQPVDLADAPAGDRLGKGRFLLRFAASGSAALGLYEVRTLERLTAASPEVARRGTFHVTLAPVGPGYCTVDDLRAEGVGPEVADDLRLLEAIETAGRQIEAWTGNVFEPRYMELALAGRGSFVLLLDLPIVAIESVKIQNDFVPFDLAPDETVVTVFNRHLRQRLLAPDDRQNPKIELGSRFGPYSRVYESGPRTNDGSIFPRGRQNVLVRGVFGYTEPDGSSTGRTPAEIRRCAMRLALREVPALTSGDAEDAAQRGRIRSESTDGQSYSIGELAGYEVITGDSEIDRVLVHYRRTVVTAVA